MSSIQNVHVRRLGIVAAILASFALSLGAGAAWGAWYQVEVIVFQQNDPGALVAESSPGSPGAPRLEGATELLPPSGGAPAYAEVPRAALALRGI